MTLPPNWSETPKESAIKRFGQWNLPIQIVQTPTYAPWCNPIKKLWKYFRQDFLHIHRFCDDLEALRAKAQHFFDDFAQGSAELLQYVGLAYHIKLLKIISPDYAKAASTTKEAYANSSMKIPPSKIKVLLSIVIVVISGYQIKSYGILLRKALDNCKSSQYTH